MLQQLRDFGVTGVQRGSGIFHSQPLQTRVGVATLNCGILAEGQDLIVDDPSFSASHL